MKVPPVGSTVAIEFLDHVEDGDEPIPFVVFGRLEKVTRHAFTLASWDYLTPPKRPDMDDENVKRWTIVRHSTTRIKQLR